MSELTFLYVSNHKKVSNDKKIKRKKKILKFIFHICNKMLEAYDAI